MRKNVLIAVSLFSFMCASAIAATPDYRVTKRIALGAPTKWDYAEIDQQRNRLYISRGTHAQVLALPSGEVIAEIPDTPGVHGFAFAQDLKLGFISNGARNSVSVFDLDTMKIVNEVKIPGVNPDAILYEPISHHLFTFNGKSHDVTVMDAKTMKVLATIKATGRPEFAVSDGEGRIYFNIEDNAGINVIDVATNSMTASWKLDGCEEPTGLAIDIAHARLFSTCQNKIMVVTDAKSGKRIANVAIGEHPDAAIFDVTSGTVFTSNGGGSLTVVHQDDADHYSVLVNVPTHKGAKTMAMDTRSKALYLPAVIENEFTVLTVESK